MYIVGGMCDRFVFWIIRLFLGRIGFVIFGVFMGLWMLFVGYRGDIVLELINGVVFREKDKGGFFNEKFCFIKCFVWCLWSNKEDGVFWFKLFIDVIFIKLFIGVVLVIGMLDIVVLLFWFVFFWLRFNRGRVFGFFICFRVIFGYECLLFEMLCDEDVDIFLIVLLDVWNFCFGEDEWECDIFWVKEWGCLVKVRRENLLL